jgi:hypothetical protein
MNERRKHRIRKLEAALANLVVKAIEDTQVGGTLRTKWDNGPFREPIGLFDAIHELKSLRAEVST